MKGLGKQTAESCRPACFEMALQCRVLEASPVCRHLTQLSGSQPTI